MNRLLGLPVLHKQHSKEANHILLPAIDPHEETQRRDRLFDVSTSRILKCLGDDALIVHGCAISAG
jgi:hypothetical protein